MSLKIPSFSVYKKILPNGLTILTKPIHQVPRVEAHLWYNVGSKDEGPRERGMAHLIEHMLFKGTKNLSESDLNIICQKLTADANAFTSQDYTCYTFRIPSNVWQKSFELLAECMQYATFDSQMLASELKAVIEELRLYKENYQGSLFENVVASIFPEHPYRNPIIGSKFDLCDLNRDDLYAFYKKHYHPANAVLVVAGDVIPEKVFEEAERCFGNIQSPNDYSKITYHIQNDLIAQTTELRRPVTSPWYCYVYKVPGLGAGKNHLLDVASLLVAAGKSSRLYQRLVNKEKIAIDVDCSTNDFFEKGLFGIGVWPVNGVPASRLEAIINEELAMLAKKPIKEWEFASAQKRTNVEFISLLESIEKQAFVIGNSYLATRDERFVEKYLNSIATMTKKDLQKFFQDYFSPAQQHKGYLIPATKDDLQKLRDMQVEDELLERVILQKHTRTKPVEPGRQAYKVSNSVRMKFLFPKPHTVVMPNGLEIVYHHNPQVAQIVCILNLKANHLYENDKQAGGLGFLLRVITDRTKKYNADAWAKLLESQGIYLVSGGDSIVVRCLKTDLEKVFNILREIVCHPSFDIHSIEKVRQQLLSDLEEYWESPIDFIDQVAKQFMYQDHPYNKNSLGTKKSLKALTKKDLQQLFSTFISPREANLVIVGDLEGVVLQPLVKKYFGSWKGPVVPQLVYPPIKPPKPCVISVPYNRDQMVLGFVAPSLSRKDKEYNALALLDIIVTGGSHVSPTSRLFQLRENSGLFYTIGGSFLYGAREEQGMMFIKTVVSADKTEMAQRQILDVIETVGKKGVDLNELEMAKNLLFASTVELFESNIQMAQTFLFLKKLNLSFNLFDKLGEILSIIGGVHVNEIAHRFCRKESISIIRVGRTKKVRRSM